MLSFFDAHPWVLPFVLWPLFSAVVTAAFRFSTSAEWESFAAKRPRLAATMRLLRALGVDVPKLLSVAKDLVDAKAEASKAKASPKDPS